MEATVYNTEGKKAGTIALPETVFGLRWNADLVHQVVTSLLGNARAPIAHTKGRGEVAGGGKKPWKQKGTGRSRHGSIRSPIWRGGGITHGPTNERIFERKVNRQMKVKALYTVLSRKMKEGEIIFVDSLSLASPKTKLASGALSQIASAVKAPSLAWKQGNRALLVLADNNTEIKKAYRNIPSIGMSEIRNINPVDALQYKYIVVERPEDAVKVLTSRAR